MQKGITDDRDLGENDRDDEIVDDTTEPIPPPVEGETRLPTLGATSGDEDFAAQNDVGPDVGPELTPDVASAEPLGDATVPEGPTLPPSDAETTESVVDPAGAPDPSTSGEAQSQPRRVATKTDWSNFVPAPGYADPKTGKPVFRIGNIDQAGMEVMLLAHGRRPIFEPQSDASGAEETTPPPFLAAPPPFLAAPPHDEGVPPFVPGNKLEGAASPLVSVDVRVTLGDGELKRVSNGAIRKAAEFSRTELLVVAQRLHELDNEIRARETQRRILARRY